MSARESHIFHNFTIGRKKKPRVSDQLSLLLREEKTVAIVNQWFSAPNIWGYRETRLSINITFHVIIIRGTIFTLSIEIYVYAKSSRLTLK